MSNQLQDFLQERRLKGIVERAGFEHGVFKGQAGVFYPAHPDTTTYPVRRWKNYDSTGSPKYGWDPAGVEPLPRYYALPGVLAAIKAAEETAHFCFGEPDVWTMALAGYDNAFCCFGDSTFPKATFIQDLRLMEISHLYVWPDHDEAGIKLATTIYRLLAAADIAVEVHLSPALRGTKYDLNRIWQDALGLPDVFQTMIGDLDPFDPSDEIAALPSSQDIQQSFNASAPDEQREVERRVRLEIEKRLTKRGGKEGYYDCPLPHGGEGKDFLYTLEGPIGGCQGKHDGQLTRWMDLALFLDIDVTGIARQVAHDYRKPDRANGHRPPATPDRPLVIDEKMAGKRLGDWMIGKSLPPGRPFLWPYAPVHRFQGNAHIAQTRSGTCIVSISGGGKTGHVGQIANNLNARGISCLMWSPENSPERHRGRSIARWGGPSVNRQRENFLWQVEKAAGVPEKERNGKPFTKAEQALFDEVNRQLDAYPGSTLYIDNGTMTVDDYCEEVGRKVWELRVQANSQVLMMVFDYAQRLKTTSGGWDQLEYVARTIAQCAIDNDLHWVLIAQATKPEEERVMRGNYTLHRGSAQGLSDQLPQLFYTLTPIYRPEPASPNVYSRHEIAKAHVCKNNDGTEGVVWVKTDLASYGWPDELAYVSNDDEPAPAEAYEEHWANG